MQKIQEIQEILVFFSCNLDTYVLASTGRLGDILNRFLDELLQQGFGPLKNSIDYSLNPKISKIYPVMVKITPEVLKQLEALYNLLLKLQVDLYPIIILKQQNLANSSRRQCLPSLLITIIFLAFTETAIQCLVKKTRKENPIVLSMKDGSPVYADRTVLLIVLTLDKNNNLISLKGTCLYRSDC